MRALRDEGTTVMVITHRMHEVWALADSMTIFRDGRTIGRYTVNEIDQREAVDLMAGRDITSVFPLKEHNEVDVAALELSNVRLRRGQAPWSLTLHHGEILGLGGLQGQGQRDFLLWLYGAGPGSGTMLREGKAMGIPAPAMRCATGSC